MRLDDAVFTNALAGEDASSVLITSNNYLDLSMGSRERGFRAFESAKKVGKPAPT